MPPKMKPEQDKVDIGHHINEYADCTQDRLTVEVGNGEFYRTVNFRMPYGVDWLEFSNANTVEALGQRLVLLAQWMREVSR